MNTKRGDNNNQEVTNWETESVADHLEDLEEVTVEVRPTLSHTLSVRITKEDYKKLRTLGQETSLGTTTMARYLLHQALLAPRMQLAFAALQGEGVRSELESMVEEGKIPPDSDEPDMYFLSGERIRKLATIMVTEMSRLMEESIKEFGKVKPGSEEYKALRDLETAKH
ncbi:MAG: hypothetical protein IH861_00465 [Chloroflexi bacterium]|nr:hypothetical protein [Chloroflexota bacterium]